MPIVRTNITSATGTTSATIPTHAIGDLIVAFAFRDGSATAPSLPGSQNWSSPGTATVAGTSCSSRVAYKIAQSTSETTGTFTNATSFIVLVIPGANGSTPVGNSGGNKGVSTSINFPALTPPTTDGGSFVLGFCGHRSTNVSIETPPSGMTNITSVSDATDEAAAHITTNGVTSWASTNASVGGTSSGWTSHVIGLQSSQSLEAGPGLQDLSNAITQIEAGLQSLKRGYAAVVGAAPGFQVDAVVMGENDDISASIGMSDGPQLTVVLWARQVAAGAMETGIQSSAGFSIASIGGSNGRYIAEINPAGTTYFDFTSNAETLPDGVWTCMMISCDTNFIAGNKLYNLYQGDTDVAVAATDADAAFNIFLSDDPWQIYAASGATWEIAEVWIDNTYIDFSVEANRRKFYSSTGKPVDLGADGSTPTGSQPNTYLSVRPGDVAADFCTNRGTGGNFTQSGTLTLASTSPSD